MRAPVWLSRLFTAIDTKDVATFAEHLAEDGRFVYGSLPPVQGRGAICDFVAGFLASVERTEHRLDEHYELPGRTLVRGQVTYLRRDGSSLSVPFCNAFELDADDRIATYQIYIDASAL